MYKGLFGFIDSASTSQSCVWYYACMVRCNMHSPHKEAWEQCYKMLTTLGFYTFHITELLVKICQSVSWLQYTLWLKGQMKEGFQMKQTHGGIPKKQPKKKHPNYAWCMLHGVSLLQMWFVFVFLLGTICMQIVNRCTIVTVHVVVRKEGIGGSSKL